MAAGTGTIPMVESVVSAATGRDTVIGVVGIDVADEKVGCGEAAVGATAVTVVVAELIVRCEDDRAAIGVCANSGVCP